MSVFWGKGRYWAVGLLCCLGVGTAAQAGEDAFRVQRLLMVARQIEARGIRDPRVLRVMREVPRHRFVPASFRREAYRDSPLPIGFGQTISQPFIVAYMTEQLGLRGDEKVLEIGTGSGYQAAVLSRLCKEVFTIEIIKPLAERARKTLERLGYSNVTVRHGDGYRGWPEEAPFDAIIVTAAPAGIPPRLVEQLKEGGRMVLPVGRGFQYLMRLEKRGKGVVRKVLLPVSFVPMVHGREGGARPAVK